MVDQDQLELIVSQVLKQILQGPDKTQNSNSEPFLHEKGEAAPGKDAKEVVIGLGPAFGKNQRVTIVDLPHEKVLREVMAGIEEEGMHARLIRVLRTSDVGFIAHDAAKISGSGVGIGIQSKGTTVIHQKDLPPLSNLELFPLAPLLDEAIYRQIGRNAARYAKGDSPNPVSVQLDQTVLPIYQPKAVLMHNKETQLVKEKAGPLELSMG
jgi:propanediol dehydratase medium subunit